MRLRFWLLWGFLILCVSYPQDTGIPPAEGLVMESLDDIERVPLADSALVNHRGLPSSADLSPHFPRPGNQGNQGSCVGWASTYALKTYHEKRKRNWDLGTPVQQGGSGEHVFSPAWTYNQINKGRDAGAHMPHALDLIIQKGAIPWRDMPYNPKDFRTQPTAAQKQLALQYRAKSFETIPPNNIQALKAELARGYPLLIGVYSGPDRWNCCKNNSVLDHFATKRRAQHAMVMVGYDDGRKSPNGHRGAFKIMDSSGDTWGTQGFGWVSYEFTPLFLYAAYVLRDWEGGGTPQPVPTDKGLAQPKGVRASQGAFPDKIIVSWQRVSNAISYQIERSAPGENNFAAIGYSEETRFADEGAAADTAFDYRVIAIGDEETSDAAHAGVARGFTASQAVKPVQVTGLGGELTAGGSILLSWSEQSTADRYVISRKQKANGEWKTIATARQNSYTDANPEPGDNFYTVSAQKNGEMGSPSEAIIVGAKGGKVGGVENFTATQGVFKDKIVLSWNRVPNATSYWIVRLNGSAWEEIAKVRTNSYEDRADAVKSGAPFAYSLRAANDGEYSNAARAAWGRTNPNLARTGEVPSRPTGVQARLTGDSVKISWQPVAGAAEYYVFRKRLGHGGYALAGIAKEPHFGEKLPYEAGLWLYTIRAKAAAGAESAASRPAAISRNAVYPTLAGLKTDAILPSLAGTWQANGQLPGDATATAVIAVAGNGVEVDFSLQGRRKKFSGSYAPGSGIAEVNGLRISKTSAETRTILITCRDSEICKKPFRAGFARTN